MLNITIKTLEGQLFTTQLDPNQTEWTCVGYGQDPKAGVCYIVGTTFDSVNNRSRLNTFLFKDVSFKGQVTPPS